MLLSVSHVTRLVLLTAVVCNGYRGYRPSPEKPTCNFEAPHKICADNTRFILFTRSDREGQRLHVTADNIAKTHFNAANPTKIIIHDFMDGIKEPSHYYIRTEYLKKGEYNLIMVDWGWLAQGPDYCYYRANNYTRHVGECTAPLIQLLRQKYQMTDVHVIGLGLGAVAINAIADNVEPKLPRATGLDPIGQRCDRVYCVQVDALKKSAADFVDVIHTSFQGRSPLGTMNQVGHVDYYVNDGRIQPGCLEPYMGSFLSYLDECSHRRAILFYTESINIGKGFYGNQCDSLDDLTAEKCPDQPPRKILMGEYALNTTRGIVSVPTANQSPYSLGP